MIHPGALGDVLLAVPALRTLRAGSDAIVVAAQPRIGALLVALGVADRALTFDALGLDALFTDAPLAADAPVARHVAPAARVVCWFGARDGHFAQRLRAIAPDAVLAPPAGTTMPVWQHLLDTVGTRADRAPITVSPVLVDEGHDALRVAGWDGRARVVVVHPGAGGAAKRWPVEGFVDVVDGIDATLVVHEGPADTDAVHAFTERARRPALRLLDPPLPTLAGVLATAAAYLGNDSGVSHLAAAIGARAVVLFTEAARPWAPWSPTARCLTVTTSTLIDAERAAVHAALRMVL